MRQHDQDEGDEDIEEGPLAQPAQDAEDPIPGPVPHGGVPRDPEQTQLDEGKHQREPGDQGCDEIELLLPHQLDGVGNAVALGVRGNTRMPRKGSLRAAMFKVRAAISSPGASQTATDRSQ